MKERLIPAFFAGLVGVAIGGAAGWVLMEDKFPIYVLLGFTITFTVVGLFAKREWREAIADWFLDKPSP